MRKLCKIISSVAVLYIAYISYKIYTLLIKTPELPRIEEEWWGDLNAETNKDIQQFKINIPSQTLEDLARRLNATRKFTPSYIDMNQEYGTHTALMEDVLQFWKENYNWKEREVYLNKYPQYTINVQGLKIHYVHVRATNRANKKILPLLLLHGWPETVFQYHDMIPELTNALNDNDFDLELIMPSLPGFGFSSGPIKSGMGLTAYAQVFKNFMIKLGYEKFYVQGDDFGAVIVSSMATLYPDRVLGLHSVMCQHLAPVTIIKLWLASLVPFVSIIPKDSRLYPFTNFLLMAIEDTGYYHFHATKPDTLGYALNDSPVGLAAYMLDKMTSSTDPSFKFRKDGGLKIKYSYTKLLDNIMVYWLTGSASTAMRIYADSTSQLFTLRTEWIPTPVPSACMGCLHDPFYLPASFLGGKFKNLVHSEVVKMGHFSAMEDPKTVARSILTGLRKILDFRNKNS